ncbi:MAG TPA: hypothetical protein VMI54_05465 [Polyangiaceae bacterium]|nr:hypothetical protein [Polyangiaceae bacterium]
MQTAIKDDQSPLRLLRRHGVWRVECTELVCVDQDVLRPELRQVAYGPEVARYLGVHCSRQRAAEAALLMQQPDDGTESAFVLERSGWEPVRTLVPSQRPIAKRDIDSLALELGTQIALMRSLYESLLARVVSLEADRTRPQQSPRSTSSVARVPTRRDVLQALSTAHPAPPPEREPAPPPAPAKAPPGDGAHAAPAETRQSPVLEPEAAEVEAPPEALLALPGAKELLECLNMLGVEDVASAPPNTPEDLAQCHRTPLVTDAGDEVGAVVFDRRGGVELGGGLLGLPESTREEQAAAGLAANTLDALNEIANNLVGIVNRANPNSHVRLRPLSLAAALSTVDAAAHSLRITTRAGGNLWIFAR